MLAPELHVPLYIALDEAANTAQRSWRSRYVRSLVLLGLIAAVTESGELIRHYSSLQGLPLKLALIALIVFSIGALLYEVRYTVQHHHRFGRWIHVRAVAEQLKSRAWLVLMRAEPETIVPTIHSAATASWQQQAESIIAGGPAPTLAPLFAQLESLQTAKQHFAGLPLAEQAAYYRQERLEKQYQYFQSRVSRLRQRANNYQRLTLFFLSTAILCGILRAADIGLEWDSVFQQYNLASVIVAIIALLKAYVETEKIESLLARYYSMATFLAEYLQAPAPTTFEALHQWVRQIEKLLLSQTKEWQIQRLQ